MYKIKKTQEMGRLSEAEFRAADKQPIVVVLDNVRSQHNVGAVFRTADAFRLARVVLCGICPTPDNTEVHKTALGAEKTVDWQRFDDTSVAIDSLHEQGYRVYAIEIAENSRTLEDFVQELPQLSAAGGGIAVVFGHEVFGVQQTVVDRCDGCIEIPQYGTKHSLNVSVTAGIVLYELSTHIARSRS